MFGREASIPPDLFFEPNKDKLGDYAHDLRDRLDEVYSRVSKHRQRNMGRQKKNYDKHTVEVAYEEGSFVWLRNDTRKKGLSPKLTSKWDGPYKILTKLSNVTYRIKRTPRSKPKVVHFDRLKPFQGEIDPRDLEPLDTPDVAPQDINELPADPVGNRNETLGTSTTEADNVETRRYPKRTRRSPMYFLPWHTTQINILIYDSLYSSINRHNGYSI